MAPSFQYMCLNGGVAVMETGIPGCGRFRERQGVRFVHVKSEILLDPEIQMSPRHLGMHMRAHRKYLG